MASIGNASMPSMWRVVLGLLLAPVVPALLVAVFAMLTGATPVSALGYALFLGGFYGAGPTLVFGTPAYLVLREQIQPTIWASMLAGAVIASVPAIAAALPFGLYVLPVAAALGAIGGCTFWFVALSDIGGRAKVRS